jgi:gliding motility-associated-like protein
MMDVDGCVVMDTVVVRVSRNKDVFAPNVISANSDGINDVFFIQGKANAYVVERLQIYDRWGNLVFEDVNFVPGDVSKGWDGTHKGKQVVSGVYVWKASLRFIDGNLEYVTGNVTVIH